MEQLTEQFQETVKSLLIRHQSILDILSKGQEASARVNRAVVKSVTSCGCLAVEAHKKRFPEDASVYDLKLLLDSNLQGELCANCRDTIQAELGKQLFYIAALANTLGISLEDVIKGEINKLSTLTIFNMT
ncbi:NTP pyrophosphohydrolase MazG, putative catalytic core [Acididesulfobacillus acetoxydans]|uniref:NTP pyrophosphohydrolase MazG, putative catalytic core n=1 Tax=Acididesulfobacillus acetoxydans TaxID=1561005 RepID=A0A8S0Y1X0_9FIRM|nr:MazG nucleotide pyrophosphohydrolase domain-containing protein [Acididesulfobacillus acetoxydans]CAA7600045.1 NTP pyrophosphohydrolase MazG, putative catalytic core [Acididesulfobacillus acetoxydans]CEJ07820.1 Phosphoribosyl-AMP cyclohydrolase domain [Acididesulfobacillus acetoxydans]